MDPTRTVLSGFNSSLWNFQIYFQCMYFLFWREGDRLVRIPTLTHERPRIINLTHGSKDRALGLGQRLQRFNSLFTHSAQVSRVWHETNFSALILRFRRRVNWWVGGWGAEVYVLTDWWCSPCKECQSRSRQSVCTGSHPAGLRPGLEALAPEIPKLTQATFRE